MHGLSEGVMKRIMPEAWDAPSGVGNTIPAAQPRSVVADKPYLSCISEKCDISSLDSMVCRISRDAFQTHTPHPPNYA